MPRLRLVYVFEFAAESRYRQDVQVDPAAFGSRWQIPGEHHLEIRFPEYREQLADELTSGYGQVGLDDAPIALMLMAFELSTEYDEARTADDLETASSHMPSTEEEDPLAGLNEADRLARETATRLVAWIKLDRPWLGATHVPPRLRAGPRVIDVESGRHLNVQLRQASPPHLASIANQPVLSSADLSMIIDEVQKGGWPPLDRLLLADARDAAHWSTAPDPKTAILFAAFALELRIKRVLFERARPEVRPLLDVLLPTRGPALVAVRDWPSKLASVAVGRSLADEEPALYRLFDRLITLRNHIAHRGTLPPAADEARDLVRAAMRVATWVDGLTVTNELGS